MKKFVKNWKMLLGLTLLCVCGNQFESYAQVNFDGVVYKQNFTSLTASNNSIQNNASIDASALPGWYVASSAVSSTLFSNKHNSTSNAAYGLLSIGNTGETERALGSYTSFQAPNGTGAISYGVRLKNVSSSTIKSLEIRFALEQWLSGADQSGLKMHYITSSAGSPITNLNYTESLWTPIVGDDNLELIKAPLPADGGNTIIYTNGNLPANRRIIVKTLSNLNVEPGGEIFIKWTDPALTDNSKKNDVLAIDDLMIAANGVPTGGFTNIFYSKSSGNLSLPSSWHSTPAGVGGFDCSGFNLGVGTDQLFILQTRGSAMPALTSEFALPAGSRVVVGPGQSIIDNNISFTFASLEVASNATVTVLGNVAPKFKALDPSSTIIYSFSGSMRLSSATYGNLKIIGGRKLLGSTGLTRVKGQLTLSEDGTLDLEGKDLVLHNPAVSVTGESCFIRTSGTGRVRFGLSTTSGKVTIPLGSVSQFEEISYTPIGLKLLGGQADTFNVRVIDNIFSSYSDGAGNDPQLHFGVDGVLGRGVVKKTWFIGEQSPSAGNDLEVTLHWKANDASVNGIDVNKMYLMHYVGSTWDRTATPQAGSLENGVYSVTRSGFTSFSPFGVEYVVSNTPDPLPVELISFTGKRSGDAVNLNWATASEKDNDYFTVEQSEDGKSFQTVKKVQGNGTSNVQQRYQATVAARSEKTLYFRLKQVDYDGKFEYSKVVAVKGGTGTGVQASLEAYPNPTPTGKVLLTTTDITGGGTLAMYHSSGKLMLQQAVQVSANQPLEVDMGTLPPGMYMVQLKTTSGLAVVRVVKQ